jgi:PAS domain S-box-containing protein
MELSMSGNSISGDDCFDMLEHAAIGAFSCLPDGRFLYANPALARMYGYATREELIDAGLPGKDGFMHLLAEHGQLSNYKYHLLRRDGSICRVYANAWEVRDKGGDVLTCQGFMTEIKAEEPGSEELMKDRQFFEAVFNSIQDGICVLDTQLNILKVNPQMRKWYGHDFSLEGKKCYSVYHGRTKPCDICPAARSLKTGKLEMDEIPLRQNSADARVLQVYAFPMLDETGKPSAVVEYVRDVTERKRAEEKLLESEEKYRSLVEQSVDMMYLHDLQGNFLDVNQAAVSHTGYSREELLNMNVFDIHLEGFNREELLQLWEEWQTGKTQTIEAIHLRKDGTTFIAEVKVGKVHFGEKDCMLALIRDITERKRAEAALRESEEKFRIVFEQSAIGMGRVSFSDARWIDVNDTFCNMLGYSREEMLATPWPDITHPDDMDLDLKPFRRMAIGELEHYTVEKRFIHKQGHHVWARLTLSLVRDAHGHPDYEIAVIENISQRKMAEDALWILTDTLEKRVTERTELAEARSWQLQKLTIDLMEAEERERRRIAGLLHDDLQQLLASARMQVQAVADRHPSIELLKNVEKILKEAIGKSRDLSHELTPPILEHADLTATMDWLSRRMQEQFGLQVQAEIRVSHILDSGPLKIYIYRALHELLFNVVKHSGEKNARITVFDTIDTLSIIVSDEGRGFDPHILSSDKIGLGLSSLKERTRFIGGSLVIDSAPGKGSRFTLTIPLGLTEKI